MTSTGWAAFAAALARGFFKAVAGSKLATRPDPASAAVPTVTLAAGASVLADVAQFLAAHASAIDAASVDADYVARALAMAGVPGAAIVDQVLHLEPSALAAAQKFLPVLAEALPMLASMQSVPQFDASGPGPGQGAFAQRGR